MKKKVIIDSDPGIDDLLAISVALASDNLDVLAISSVFGNVSLENTTENMKLIVSMFNKDIPIIKGSSKPLIRDRKESSIVHGSDGLANLRLKYSDHISDEVKVSEGLIHLYNLIKSHDKINIIALGPLTNIAKLLLFDESIKDHIDQIHIMGGGDRVGNITKLSEFNFYSDSEAAKIILNSDLDIYLSSLDVTKKVYFNSSELDSFKDTNDKLRLIKDSLRFYVSFDPYLHDVTSVLSLSKPELFKFEKTSVNILNSNDDSDGMLYKLDLNNNLINYVDTNNRKKIIEYIFDLLYEKYL